jgi:pilus assembly protein CpaB
MKSRSTTIIGAGVAVAILGAVLVFAYARSLQGSAGATGTNVGAYVATSAIPTGTKGSSLPSFIKTANVPSAARPADALTSLTQVSTLVALRNISAGEVISASQFGSAGTPNTDTTGLTIPAGKNAITVTSPVPQAVAGYVSPGDLVNIYLTTKAGDQGARLLLSNISVLATVPANTPKVASGAAAPQTGDVYFTLALSPQEAEKIIFSQTYESLWYGLVHPGDGPVATTGQTVKTIFAP